MVTQRLFLSALVLCLMVSGLPREASAEAQEPLALILIDHVKPAQVKQYEAALIGMMALLKEHDASFSILVNSTDDSRYIHRVEIDGWAGIGEVYSRWGDLAKKIGEPWSRLDARLTASIDHSDIGIAKYRSDLSYSSSEPRVKAGEVGHVHYDFYYLAPGKTASFEKAVKGHAAYVAGAKASDSFWVYQTVLGGELPLYVVIQVSHGLADFYDQEAKVRAALPAGVKSLEERVQATLRRLDKTEALSRAELSYP